MLPVPDAVLSLSLPLDLTAGLREMAVAPVSEPRADGFGPREMAVVPVSEPRADGFGPREMAVVPVSEPRADAFGPSDMDDRGAVSEPADEGFAAEGLSALGFSSGCASDVSSVLSGGLQGSSNSESRPLLEHIEDARTNSSRKRERPSSVSESARFIDA